MLEEWYFKCKAADWESFADMRRNFNTVDYVGNDRYVFNTKWNHCRLVAMIFFSHRTMFVRCVGTHCEYDTLDATTI